MNREVAIATYFTSLKLVNFRGFEDVDLDLLDEKGKIAQWTLLLGDNGVGKTTLLQALAWMRPLPEEEPDARTGGGNDSGSIEVMPANDAEALESADTADVLKPIKKGSIGCGLTFEDNDTIEGLFRIGAQEKFQLIARLWQGGEIGVRPEISLDRSGKPVSTNVTFHFENAVLRDESKGENPTEEKVNIERQLGGAFWGPFIIAYGANRSTNPIPSGEGRLLDELAANLSPSGTQLHDAEKELTALQGAVNEQHLEWLSANKESSAKDADSAVKSEEKRLLNNFKRIIFQMLPFVASESDIEIRAQRVVKGEVLKAQVSLQMYGKPVPFSQLSLGYQTTLTWALDLAWQLSKQYSSFDDPLEQPAIVLIDEIDLHLHPHWQWTIMRRLSELFPRTQFIATSHSPLMVQSMPDANFAIVQEVDGKMEIENRPEIVRGWRIDQILNSEYFGFDHAWDPKTEALFEERRSLLRIESRNAEEEKRLVSVEKEIEEIPVANSPEDRRAMELIRKAADILKRISPAE